jgi:phage/plasmid-like protein (TIGR03299 family)
MAHEIDTQKGFAGFASYKQTAWHGLGTVLEERMTIADALTFGGLDFEVLKAPNVHRFPDATERVSKDSFFTYRTDTNCVLGDKLGKGYTVMQNKVALDLVDELVSKQSMTIETVGSLCDGAKVFVTLKNETPIDLGNNDITEQYLVLLNGHDGNTAISAYFTNVRVVCQNTLNASLGLSKNKHTVRHTVTAKDRLTEALIIMGVMQRNTDLDKQAYQQMKAQRFTDKMFSHYLGNVFFTPHEITELKKGDTGVISSRKRNVIAEVVNFAHTGIGQDLAGEGSAFWAYNAVTGYFSNQKVYKDTELRMDNLLWGTDASVMNRASELALMPEKMVNLDKNLVSSLMLN